MRVYKYLSLKDKISLYIIHKELPGFVDTKGSKFYPIMRPLFCSIGGRGNDKRQLVKDIFAIIYLFFFKSFHQFILDSDIAERGLFLSMWIIQLKVNSLILQL